MFVLYHSEGKKVRVKKITVSFAFVVVSVFMLNNATVMADGLEADKAMPTTKPLLVSPPPVVEDVSELFIPPEPEVLIVEAPAPPQKKENLWPIISQGMILLKSIPEGTIAASEDQKQLLGQGDLVYLRSNDDPLLPDHEWVVFKGIKDVYHPKTGVLLGKLVHVLGMVKSIDADEKVATARIIRSREPISVGDQIASIKRFLPHMSEEGLPPEKGDEGFIVEVKDNRKNIAQHDIVYIDYGREEGVSRGDGFIVVHKGERNTLSLAKNPAKAKSPTNNNLPFRKIGTMVVLATQAHTATAKITRSIEPIAKGDTILFHPHK